MSNLWNVLYYDCIYSNAILLNCLKCIYSVSYLHLVYFVVVLISVFTLYCIYTYELSCIIFLLYLQFLVNTLAINL